MAVNMFRALFNLYLLSLSFALKCDGIFNSSPFVGEWTIIHSISNRTLNNSTAFVRIMNENDSAAINLNIQDSMWEFSAFLLPLDSCGNMKVWPIPASNCELRLTLERNNTPAPKHEVSQTTKLNNVRLPTSEKNKTQQTTSVWNKDAITNFKKEVSHPTMQWYKEVSTTSESYENLHTTSEFIKNKLNNSQHFYITPKSSEKKEDQMTTASYANPLITLKWNEDPTTLKLENTFPATSNQYSQETSDSVNNLTISMVSNDEKINEKINPNTLYDNFNKRPKLINDSEATSDWIDGLDSLVDNVPNIYTQYTTTTQLNKDVQTPVDVIYKELPTVGQFIDSYSTEKWNSNQQTSQLISDNSVKPSLEWNNNKEIHNEQNIDTQASSALNVPVIANEELGFIPKWNNAPLTNLDLNKDSLSYKQNSLTNLPWITNSNPLKWITDIQQMLFTEWNRGIQFISERNRPQTAAEWITRQKRNSDDRMDGKESGPNSDCLMFKVKLEIVYGFLVIKYDDEDKTTLIGLQPGSHDRRKLRRIVKSLLR